MAAARIPVREVRKIAIFRALFLGDLLCATPAFRALRHRFPAAEITLIGLPWAAELVARVPELDRLRLFPGYPGLEDLGGDPQAADEFLARERAYGYDLALQMHGDGRSSNGFVAALGARSTLGYRRGNAPDDRLSWSMPYTIDEHETLRWLRLVAAIGAAPTEGTRLSMTRTVGDDSAATGLLADAIGGGPLIGLHLGAKEEARRWPIDRYVALAEQLVARLDARIVLTGGEAERPLVAETRQRACCPALDLAGRTDFGTFAATIAGLDLLVTNDTGASHVAAAVGTPSVILFGPSRPEHWAPLDRVRHRALDARMLTAEPDDGAGALRRLSVEPVLAACLEQLAALPAKERTLAVAQNSRTPEKGRR